MTSTPGRLVAPERSRPAFRPRTFSSVRRICDTTTILSAVFLFFFFVRDVCSYINHFFGNNLRCIDRFVHSHFAFVTLGTPSPTRLNLLAMLSYRKAEINTLYRVFSLFRLYFEFIRFRSLFLLLSVLHV